MTPEKDRILRETFPVLYKDKFSLLEDSRLWGFDIGDGWYDILFNLSTKLQNIIEKLPENSRDKYKAVEVKEELGVLRFIMKTQTYEMTLEIREAQKLSVATCETCGKDGKVRVDIPWVQTLCQDHYERNIKE